MFYFDPEKYYRCPWTHNIEKGDVWQDAVKDFTREKNSTARFSYVTESEIFARYFAEYEWVIFDPELREWVPGESTYLDN